MEKAICAKFESAFQVLGKRWTGLIVNQLMNGPKRFNELENEIKISGRVLSLRLKELASQDIVSRTVYPEMPVRIEYTLTKKGYALKPIMEEISNWGDSWV